MGHWFLPIKMARFEKVLTMTLVCESVGQKNVN
jgi:hypothetical protein